ncbi:MAG: multidrug transporter AcrB [Coxiella sp. RIFCSPHIGHO2_12_FULL_44_14]|nr:MAG: multidrug transporter AcrB [Coxiella sp. RIFCSPHIGHO2_12_FULL_44_14]
MTISEICIKRPVFATVLNLILMVIGIMGLNYLDTRFLPNFESHHLTVTTSYPGASAPLVETSITTPLEDAISGIEGIDTLSSTSSQNVSQIEVALKDGADIDQVMNKVRTQIENARSRLPSSVLPPDVEVRNPGSGELMDIGVVDSSMALPAIRDYLQRYVIKDIQQVQGVSNVNIAGANEYILRINLDPKKMSARRVTLDDVQQAVNNSNIELPAGKIKGMSFDFPITAVTKINTAQEFNAIVVKQEGTNSIFVRDIGHAEITPDPSSDSVVRINNQPGILLSINGTDDANPIDTAKRIMHLLTKLKDQQPFGMSMVVAYDQSDFMKQSIHEVYLSIVFAIVCVLMVIYAFLGHLRSVSIPIVTIPICLLAMFGVMYFMGFTINIITLLALVLSIGLVVDDAIVMLENIHRHIEKGEKPMIAAIKGSKEITFAVVAMTLTLAAVYAPVGFVHGKISAIFKPFAFTLAGAVIISGFVALTLSPVMCSRLLKSHTSHTPYLIFLNRFFETLASNYQRALNFLLNKRYLVMITMVFIIVGGVFLLRSIPNGFMPEEDMGLVIGQVSTPSGANIQYIADHTKSVANLLNEEPGVQSVVSIADTSQQSFNVSFAILKPFDQRSQSAQQIANEVNQRINTISGLNAFAFSLSMGGGSMKHQVEFDITANKTYRQLYDISKNLVDALKKYPGLKQVESNLTFDSQQYEVHINRDLAAQLNVSVSSIDNEIAAMLGGIKISTIDVEGQSYDVYMMGYDRYWKNLDGLNDFFVTSSTNQLVPLSNVVTVKPVLSQTSLTHYDRQRSATIDAQLGEGYRLGEVVNYLEKSLPQMLPNGAHYAFEGMSKNIADSNSSMGLIFVLALVFIYLVLSAQFESFLDPFVILFAVPFSVIGALLALKLINGSINIYTIVGLVTLIGLIAKHGILITQFTNELREKGVELKAALVQAATIRLRPILMTTAAMVFGAMPLIFASGASAVSRQQIGAVLISGLLFGTFFSLVLVPVTYLYVDQCRQKLRRK